MSIKQNYDTISRLQEYIGGVMPPFEIMDVVFVSRPLLIVNGMCNYNCISDQVIEDDTDTLNNKIRMVATIDVYNRVMNISTSYTDEDAFRNKSVYVCLCRDDGGCVTIGNMEHFVKIDADHGTSIYVPTENMTEEIISSWRLLIVVVNDAKTLPRHQVHIFARDDKLYCRYVSGITVRGITVSESRVIGMQKFKLFEASRLWMVQLMVLDWCGVATYAIESDKLTFADNLRYSVSHIPSTIGPLRISESTVRQMLL